MEKETIDNILPLCYSVRTIHSLYFMSFRICSLCGKKPKRSATRSHSNIQTLRRQHVNIQKIKGQLLCTRCLKTQRKNPR